MENHIRVGIMLIMLHPGHTGYTSAIVAHFLPQGEKKKKKKTDTRKCVYYELHLVDSFQSGFIVMPMSLSNFIKSINILYGIIVQQCSTITKCPLCIAVS